MRRGLNSRFVRLMRTGPVDGLPVVGGGGGPQGQGQQQDGGQQGAGGGGPPADQQGQQGQQQGQGDPFGGLLDQARQQQAGDQQQGQQGGQQGQQSGPLTAEDVARIVESAVDRRINAINNPGGGRGRGQQAGTQQQGQQQGQQGEQQPVARVDQGARREARLAFREYVGDQIRFLSDVERAAANQIGTAMIATWDGDGDADQFGRHVAGQVAATVKDLGEMYKRTTIEALRKQGLLKDQPSGPGAGSALAGFPLPTGGTGFVLPTNGVQQKNPQAAIQNAISLADQYNQRAGYVKQQ